MALPLAGADAVGEGCHLVEHRVDARHNVFSIEEDALGPGRAQGDVQDGAVLGEVDLVAAKHGFDAVAQAGLFGEGDEQAEGFGGDAVLGVVEEDAVCLGGEALAASGVFGEEIAQMGRTNRLEMALQRLPCGALVERQAGGGLGVHRRQFSHSESVGSCRNAH